MESDLQPSPDLGYLMDNDDANCVRLSTIMVATIQEVKDRISQIEYVFCAQLFPKLNSRPKRLLKRFSEVMKAAEDVWRKKETQFLTQIEELHIEKNEAIGKHQNAEAIKAAEDGWIKKESQFLTQIEELQLEKEKALEENYKMVASLEQKAKSMSDADDNWKRKETILQSEITKLLNQMGKDLEGNQNAEAMKAADEGWRKNESQFLIQIEDLQLKNKEVYEENQNLVASLKLKDVEMVTEKKKRKDVIDMYKRLKSQYNFLCNKFGLNTENSLPNNRIEDESISSERLQTPKVTHVCNDGNRQISRTTSMMKEPKEEKCSQGNLEDGTVSRLYETSGSHSNIKLPSASRPRDPVSVKCESLAGTKRPVPHWRDTRRPQEAGGADPHDDFLDTPLQIVKGNLNRAIKEEVHDFPVPPPKDMEFNSSDDETQDMNLDPAPQKQRQSAIKTGDKSFKYVEPVRKKADRDNLKGFECKQCKKFYDAVLPDNGKNGENNANFRCEHQDGVSRHRYKYLPPSTPEGFWNIGFESEM